MCFNKCAWCQCTRGRLESTHGKRFESTHGGHRQFCLPKFAHIGLSRAPEVHRKKPLDGIRFQFEKRSRITCSRVLQSFALPDEAVPTPALLGKRWREPTVRWFDLSFAPMKQVLRTICALVSPDCALLTDTQPQPHTTTTTHTTHTPHTHHTHTHNTRHIHIHIYIHIYRHIYI